jgi:putative hydrolase of the HAD superfamily
VVTFDAGQTLVDLDVAMLAERLVERGVHVASGALREAAPAAWDRYDAVVDAGGARPWHALVAALLELAGVRGARDEIVDWLWSEQPRKNLWRAPIADMIALARELAAAGVRVGVVSNSEGRLAELFVEIGIDDAFAAVIDSGRIGIEKPDARIFAQALDALGGTADRAVHIGDSWPADIVGALGAGWRAVWFGRRAGAGERSTRGRPAEGVGQRAEVIEGRVAIAHDAGDVRRALAAWGIVAAT